MTNIIIIYMNVLLIYPKTPLTFWSFKNAIEFIGKRASEPPLGLITVAALLPAAWERKLVDTNVTSLTDQDIEWADLVFLSGMDLHRDSFLRIADRCKSLGATIVGGGPFCTMHHPEIESVDHFVLNEAEITLPQFLKDFAAGSPRKIYASDDFPEVSSSPTPEWNLLDLNAYATMDVQYSRGCPFNCDFCSVTMLYGHKPRCKTTSQFLNELEALYQEGWRGNVFVVDDNLIGNKRKLKEDLLPALTKWSADRAFPFLFNAEVSVNLADDPELIDDLVNAGFRMVFVGIETPDNDSLVECGKVQNQGRDLVEAVKILQRRGLNVYAGFIIGFDNDRDDIFDRMIGFIQKSGIITAMVGLLTAQTGTRLFDRLRKENRIVHTTTGNNTDGVLNFVPNLDRTTLLAGYRRVVQTIYSPKEFYHRVKTFFSEYQMPKISDSVHEKSSIRAFFRAVWRIGVKEKGRKYFWMLLVHILRTRPSAFAEAVRMTIYGYHFRKVSAEL